MKIKGFANPPLLKLFIRKAAATVCLSPDKCDYYSREVEVDTEIHKIEIEGNLVIVCQPE